MQKCHMCGITEDKVEFHKNSRRCKKCTSIYKKQYREKNKELIKKKDKQYRLANKEYLLEKQRKYRASKAETIRKRAQNYRNRTREERRKVKREYEKYKRQTDLLYKIKINISSTVYRCIKNAKETKSIKNFLPYSILELKIHLESKFEPWMNWSNWGVYKPDNWNDNDNSTWTWQIDHIIPQSDLLYTSMEDENFKKCWSLDNLRPYSAKQNIFDGVNRIRHGLTKII